MTDLMTEKQYKKACRYRMRETLENLANLWETSEELVDQDMINKSLDMLYNSVDELKYFREKIVKADKRPEEGNDK